MARIRTIKPDFFRHEGLYDAERSSGLPLRIAFAGLWTAADREGRFVWSPRTLKLDCLPYDDVDFGAVLDALAEHGFICKYEVAGKQYGFIPAWSKHQHINLREAQSSLPDPSSASTCNNVRARVEGNGREGEWKGMEGKGRERVGRVHEARRPASEDDFQEFQKNYPKRGASNPSKPARELFFALTAGGVPSDRIIAGARLYASECEERKIVNTDKVAQAVTWLQQERFNDYCGDQIDPEKQQAIERDMAARGYAWSGEKWEKREHEDAA